jgi:hypothetical protein
MTNADLLVERSAEGLEQLARRAAGRGDGIGEWLAEELAADAAFLRRLKPSLIAARVRGEAPADQPGTPSPPPPTPQLGPRGKRNKKRGGAPLPLILVGAALVTGIVIAKLIDWRGHAHPRD